MKQKRIILEDLANKVRKDIIEKLTDGFIHYGHTGKCTKLCMQIKKDIKKKLMKY